MEKPLWRRRSSRYIVDSPHLRIRADEVELPDGTVIADYYVRESHGFVVVLALTTGGQVVLVREYRYGSDALHLGLPAGTIDDGEDPLDCAARELAEETGYEAERIEAVAAYYAEPVRATTLVYLYVATGARRTREQKLDPTETIDVELASLADFRLMLRDGRIDSNAAIAAGYRALDHLNAL
jgi:8-oxo-dGTP pyrophosphatase MutT (NUDIX family)